MYIYIYVYIHICTEMYRDIFWIRLVISPSQPLSLKGVSLGAPDQVVHLLHGVAREAQGLHCVMQTLAADHLPRLETWPENLEDSIWVN